MHIHSTAQIVEAAAAAAAPAAAGAGAEDTMAALEAQAVMDKGTRLPGFVSAGVIQQGQDNKGQAQAGAAEGQQQQAAAGEHLGSRWCAYCLMFRFHRRTQCCAMLQLILTSLRHCRMYTYVCCSQP